MAHDMTHGMTRGAGRSRPTGVVRSWPSLPGALCRVRASAMLCPPLD